MPTCAIWARGSVGGADGTLYGVVHVAGRKTWNQWPFALYENKGAGGGDMVRASGRAASKAAAQKRLRELAPYYGDGRLKGSWRCLRYRKG